MYYQFKKNNINRILNIFKKNFNNKQYKILDLGCGKCCISAHLENMGHSVTSLDVVNLGSCKKPKIFDGKNIPYDDNTFDIVLCSFVLHHTNTWKKLLLEMKRVAKYVIIVENTPETDLDWWFIKQHSKSDWGSCLKCFKTTSQWKNIYYKLNFKLLSVERLSRLNFPFSDKPWFYPVPSTVFILSS
uniref:Methyltransferase type 11 domain-containing protein n=1 Tax=viral metagenome TaxID=1070528 RepID=A0A6C0EAU0_9ZZZZ